ncbi:hypothetical protein GCM10027516_11750 [Niabella aquatica]
MPIKDQSPKLNGTWELTYITGPRITFDGLYPDKKPQITFKLPATEAEGHTSCNGFGVNFTITGNQISFSDPVSTLMACKGAGEPTFNKFLKATTSYSIGSDDVLTFLGKGGVELMKFKRK